MSDTALNYFLAEGTDAARAAFTPSPPTVAAGPSPAYFWYTTDTKHLWVYNSGWIDLGFVGGSWGLNGPISPTALAADQNDYNPTGLSTANVIRQDASAAVNITGLAGGSAGRMLLVINISASFAITLKNESASSAAANRFDMHGDITLQTGDWVWLWYDGTSSRWRPMAVGSGGGGTVTSVAADATYVDASPNPIVGAGTVAATTLTKSAVDSALHALCGGI